ncbi:hypothetical protein SAMN04488546_0505 [Geodermatophilus poikilotrophus]|uniref:Uncharacterized protein n=1 Tax=Geodermatophilus poikilotrophus TaxID=1333667 RepID=A0A1H9ZB73_9ACTN|nr:hypothetical protein SAMN04488546_0505 [Geodermatophilus poikilotrophus]
MARPPSERSTTATASDSMPAASRTAPRTAAAAPGAGIEPAPLSASSRSAKSSQAGAMAPTSQPAIRSQRRPARSTSSSARRMHSTSPAGRPWTSLEGCASSSSVIRVLMAPRASSQLRLRLTDAHPAAPATARWPSRPARTTVPSGTARHSAATTSTSAAPVRATAPPPLRSGAAASTSKVRPRTHPGPARKTVSGSSCAARATTRRLPHALARAAAIPSAWANEMGDTASAYRRRRQRDRGRCTHRLAVASRDRSSARAAYTCRSHTEDHPPARVGWPSTGIDTRLRLDAWRVRATCSRRPSRRSAWASRHRLPALLREWGGVV